MAMDLDEFCPTDSELLTFLLRFIAKEPLRDDGFITECDVYKQEPWLTYSYGRHSCGDITSSYRYFITPIHKKRGRMFCKSVGDNIGKWKQKYDYININRGRKKSLIYNDRNNMC